MTSLDLFIDYDLPPSLIAQEPASPRDASRLMVVDRASGRIEHAIFRDLPALLARGDTLVLNDTRVISARLFGRRALTGGKWEGLFLAERGDGAWEMLCQTGGRPSQGEEIVIQPGELSLVLEERGERGRWFVRPRVRGGAAADALALLERFGHVPLPPYIHDGLDRPTDRERYQTVYARLPGAVAAPTAGLHFTPEVFRTLETRGIRRTFVTLHVGVGTFEPIQTEDPRAHRMHAEWGELSEQSAKALSNCRSTGGRFVAVGTTAVRVLETASRDGKVKPWRGTTDLFIHAPYAFRAVDALVTNFHLPRSTLLLLVGAFVGTELLREAYQKAVEQRYRFYSYGDAMLIR